MLRIIQLISATEVTNNVMSCAYETENNLLSITDANNQTTHPLRVHSASVSLGVLDSRKHDRKFARDVGATWNPNCSYVQPLKSISLGVTIPPAVTFSGLLLVS